MDVTKEKYFGIHRNLINECLKNNRKAQIELYKLYSGAIYNTCLRIVKDSVKAEDIMQETFIIAFNKLATYKGDSTFGIWLKQIAINKSIDEFRKDKVAFEDIEESSEALKIEDYDIEFDNDSDDIIKQVKVVKQAIQLLPDGYRIVLTLYLLEGYDHEEIAQIMNISESTSRSQFVRAKHKLKELLTNKFGFRYERK